MVSHRMRIWRAIGPGLLFSGAAVGVSHLVQSTRAGAMFGLALVGVIILINILKYPAFRFGVDYAHATRQSLLHGYRELGSWALIIFLIAIAPIAPIVLAATSATTAGIITALAGPSMPIPTLAALVLAGATAILMFGGYQWLDRINRVLLAFLIVSTIAATVMVLPRVEWGSLTDIGWAADPLALLFIVALAGFMPNPVDASVPVSIWTVESEKDAADADRSTLGEMRTGFAWSFALSAVLALCFCIMGAGVMFAGGVNPAPDAAGFAAQIIALYSETLGPQAAMIASIAALSVMASTVIAATDAYARSFAEAYADRQPGDDPARFRAAYTVAILAEVGLAVAALYVLLSDFSVFIDFVTSASFLIAPVVALLNHLVVTRCTMPDGARPAQWIRLLSIAAIIVMSLLALAFLVLRLS
ncbi:divalent metal cation transporter [Parasphingopyxis sp. CP4]|uniref:NRAMP family divalent metal transporter n=1 Tax=Parasphingopyxis sp. CP4 TaxID=2724527 RepID=UPI0015A4EBFB|nr:divalent metal cation transporter [Parasphingopyxis sp. CP4]QLC21868.1 divalent metal cation transporter [Parasphingopyxis sp. CP4]